MSESKEFKIDRQKLRDNIMEQIVSHLNGQFELKIKQEPMDIGNSHLSVYDKNFVRLQTGNRRFTSAIEKLVTYLIETIADLKLKELSLKPS